MLPEDALLLDRGWITEEVVVIYVDWHRIGEIRKQGKEK